MQMGEKIDSGDRDCVRSLGVSVGGGVVVRSDVHHGVP